MANKGDKTKTQILQTAKKFFIEKGYAAVSMSDLCNATGLSHGGYRITNFRAFQNLKHLPRLLWLIVFYRWHPQEQHLMER